MTAAPPPSAPAPRRIAFLYLGRKGGVARIAWELARAAQRRDDIDALSIVSRSHELSHLFDASGAKVVRVATFDSGAGVVGRLYRLPGLAGAIASAVRAHRAGALVVLLSHLWSPFLTRTLRRCAPFYAVMVHDAATHPGDHRGVAIRWMLRDARGADAVLALSETVAGSLVAAGVAPRERIETLFHPALRYAEAARPRWDGSRPIRLLFFGRIMAYKGLPIFVGALERLRERGVAVSATVAGEGDLGPERPRLEALGATIVNRWIADDEAATLMATHDAMALTHVEASQSGVAAAAMGAGLPVVATPVGGLVEQVADGEDGLLAARPDVGAVADALARLAGDPALHARLAAGAARRAEAAGADAFLTALLAALERRGAFRA